MALIFGQTKSRGSVCCSPPEFQTSLCVLHNHLFPEKQVEAAVCRLEHPTTQEPQASRGGAAALGRGDLWTSLLLAAGTWSYLKRRLRFYSFSVKRHKTELPFFWAAFSCIFQTLSTYKEVEKQFLSKYWTTKSSKNFQILYGSETKPTKLPFFTCFKTQFLLKCA